MSPMRLNKKPGGSDGSTPADQPPAKNPHAQALGRLGRLGGLKGGKARAASMTKAQRSEIARKAAAARWKKKPS